MGWSQIRSFHRENDVPTAFGLPLASIFSLFDAVVLVFEQIAGCPHIVEDCLDSIARFGAGVVESDPVACHLIYSLFGVAQCAHNLVKVYKPTIAIRRTARNKRRKRQMRIPRVLGHSARRSFLNSLCVERRVDSD